MASPTFRSRERERKTGRLPFRLGIGSLSLSLRPFQRSQFNRLNCHLHDVCEQFGHGGDGNEATVAPTTKFMTPKHEWQASKQSKKLGEGLTGSGGERRGVGSVVMPDRERERGLRRTRGGNESQLFIAPKFVEGGGGVTTRAAMPCNPRISLRVARTRDVSTRQVGHKNGNELSRTLGHSRFCSSV